MTCPKCGSEAGWSGPTYERHLVGPFEHERIVEALLFACETCGYTRREPTKDAPPLAPPANVVAPFGGWRAWFGKPGGGR